MKKIVFALLLCMLSLSAFCQSSVSLGGSPIEWQVKNTNNPIKGGAPIRKSPAKLPTPPEVTEFLTDEDIKILIKSALN